MSTPAAGSNKRIARNTLMLYFRMLLSMAVTLYTSRVVLNVLGVEDFGIYNVVGGIIIMLGFLNNAMTASTQRFLIYEIGTGDTAQLKKVFRMSVTIHIVIAAFVLVLAESLGIWFLNYFLKIPPNRLYAAHWVYQLSVFSFVITVLSVPYNALIIAHEKMKTFAFIGIIEVFMKLGIVFVLVLFTFDKLILYALLLFFISVIIRVIYGVYCSRQFEESRNYSFSWDKELFKSMGNFAGWNLLGVSAGIAYNQGVNILLNIFFGATVNAARGIAFQVQSAVYSFVTNFQVAVNPSITKLYAQGDSKASFKLVFSSSKFSFYLLLLLSMPLLLETRTILTWWLKIVPDYTVVFTRLVLVDILVGSISGSIQSLVQATGNIKKYQILVSGILLLNLPTSYVFLKLGYSPEYTLFVSIFYSILALGGRLAILKELIRFPVQEFVVSVISRIVLVVAVTASVGILAGNYIPDAGWKFIVMAAISTITVLFSVFMLGLDRSEKGIVKDNYSKLKNKLNL